MLSEDARESIGFAISQEYSFDCWSVSSPLQNSLPYGKLKLNSRFPHFPCNVVKLTVAMISAHLGKQQPHREKLVVAVVDPIISTS